MNSASGSSMKRNRILLLLSLMLAVLCTSCIKEPQYLTDGSARLAFSDDTVKFDTVFTTMGTTTLQVKVYNNYDEPLLLDAVTLLKGHASRFRINVDGDSSMVARNVEIEAHDSIFLFVQANINPNDQTSPFLVTDSVCFRFNNSEQYLPLMAFGRNAVYHLPTSRVYSTYINQRGQVDTLWYPYSVIDCDNWDHTRPHVIFGYAVVNSNETLHLYAGDELFFADNAYLWVYDSATLDARGTQGNPIRFTSLRHDGWYDSLPGQWGYIWLSTGSKDNHIEWARIENGMAGIVVDTNVNSNPTLTISNSVIQNHSLSGIIGQGAYIEGDNLLVCNCGNTVLQLQFGGRYRFSNSTFANYWRYGSRSASAVVLNNYYNYDEQTLFPRDLLQADFYNCIIYGNYTTRDGADEFLMDYNPAAAFNCRLDHCIVRCSQLDTLGHSSADPSLLINCHRLLLNQDPRFVDPRMGDYHLGEESPAIGAADNSHLLVSHDLDGTPRAYPPSIGAFEYQPQQAEKKRPFHR